MFLVPGDRRTRLVSELNAASFVNALGQHILDRDTRLWSPDHRLECDGSAKSCWDPVAVGARTMYSSLSSKSPDSIETSSTTNT